MKVLIEKLDLTAEQQSKIRPIMLELHDYTVKLMQDKSLSQQERLDKVRPRRIEAGEKVREFLTEDQKTKLNAYLQGPHRELHGDLSGGGAGAPSPK
jgi:Spy/CpxP family protein refolding chaperone